MGVAVSCLSPYSHAQLTACRAASWRLLAEGRRGLLGCTCWVVRRVCWVEGLKDSWWSSMAWRRWGSHWASRVGRSLRGEELRDCSWPWTSNGQGTNAKEILESVGERESQPALNEESGWSAEGEDSGSVQGALSWRTSVAQLRNRHHVLKENIIVSKGFWEWETTRSFWLPDPKDVVYVKACLNGLKHTVNNNYC